MEYKDLRILPRLDDSLSFLYVDKGSVEQDDKSISVFDELGKMQIPVASLTLLMLGPGTKITHAAVRTTTEAGCLISWTGEEGVRFYAQGMGETRSSARLMKQAALVSDKNMRLAVAKEMYRRRFADRPSKETSLQALRGMEGVRVRTIYAQEAKKHGVDWKRRSYKRASWEAGDPLNRALSAANACLYGICHSAIVTLGLSPGLGFIHLGKQLSFVYDVADLYKAELTIPAAFEMAAKQPPELEREVRLKLRDIFRERKLLERIVTDIDELLLIGNADDGRWDSGDFTAPGDLLDEQGAAPGGVNHGDSDP